MTPSQINKYLRAKGSPLAGKGLTFVREARRNGLDPALLVAISGAESSFGKSLNGKFNPFGWGPGIDFRSWDDAISKVARGLRTGYADQGLKTIPAIGGKWAPQGASNDPTNLNSNWTRNVGRFYSELGGKGVTPSTPSVQPTPLSQLPSTPSPSPLDLTGYALGNLRQIAAGRSDPVASLSALTEQLAAASGQVTPSAPVAPSQANQPASGAPPQGAPAASGSGGFDPAFETALNQMVAASGGRVWVTSGYRSPEHQAELFAAAVKKYGSEAAARKWVAPPGKSQHNMGVAADLGGDLEWVRQNAARFGLIQPMSWEKWHWSSRPISN